MDPKELARQLEEGETVDELAQKFDITRKWDNRQIFQKWTMG
jgi:uncharacterized protein (DUF433 family)